MNIDAMKQTKEVRIVWARRLFMTQNSTWLSSLMEKERSMIVGPLWRLSTRFYLIKINLFNLWALFNDKLKK